ncbi:MAG: tRNA (guanosine(37)-N1)-methyltransferase TrmD [Oscillospiraceae bacterium]|jgi:tRNA (guanine37-N1)-methyltransferase|nr:tRNA (guanosine(37)-N1)-methyltransferase TrmD [Oscillospiraceae bacterium]
MKIEIMTLFPAMCEAVLGESIIGRARAQGLVEIHTRNIRDYTKDKHRRVDDAPFGGGYGMVMQAQPIADCFRALCADWGSRPRLIYLSPQGKPLTQQRCKELARLPHLALLCGHYEGVDERVLEALVDEEISIGDYVLTGGELPALVLADAITRLLPGVLAADAAYIGESHYNGLLEHPQYTRPAVWEARAVPEVLLNGNHALQEQWRREQALERTKRKRPDLLRAAEHGEWAAGERIETGD